jgi:hypothetical protein
MWPLGLLLHFCDYLPFEEDLALYLNKLEFPSVVPRIICTKFDRIWLVGSGEDFFKIFSVFLLFCYYLPLERDNPPHLKNLNPLPLRMNCGKFG